VKKRYVSASVRLDVGTHSRLSAAAALAGMTKTTFMEKAITDALQGIIVIDRRKAAGQGDPSGEEDRPDGG
jgi:predicted transcriptional regulator